MDNIELGAKARCKVTGFTGVVIAITTYLYAPPVIGVAAASDKGVITEWFPPAQLDVTEGEATAAPAAPKPAAAPAAPKPAPAAAKPAAAPAAPKPAPKPAAAPAPAATDMAAEVRAKLKKVLDDKGANEVRKVLGKVGASKLSEVPEDKMEELMGHIKVMLGEADAPEGGDNTDPFA